MPASEQRTHTATLEPALVYRVSRIDLAAECALADSDLIDGAIALVFDQHRPEVTSVHIRVVESEASAC